MIKRILFASLFFCVNAYSFDYMGWGGAPMYTSDFFMQSAMNNMMYLNQSIINENVGGNKNKTKSKTKITTKSTVVSQNQEANQTAHQMVSKFPAEYQAKMEQAFKESYKVYLQLEASVGIPKGDIAGAMAGFIVANYEVVQGDGTVVPKEGILAVTNQLRSSLSASSQFAQASMADKKTMYELMGTMAAFVALANHELKQHPNPEGEKNLKNMSNGLLESLLKTPVKNISINQDGMRIK